MNAIKVITKTAIDSNETIGKRAYAVTIRNDYHMAWASRLS